MPSALGIAMTADLSPQFLHRRALFAWCRNPNGMSNRAKTEVVGLGDVYVSPDPETRYDMA